MIADLSKSEPLAVASGLLWSLSGYPFNKTRLLPQAVLYPAPELFLTRRV